MAKGYQVKFGPVIEAGTSVSITVGAEAIAKPVDNGWEAEVVGIGYKVVDETYKAALDRCIERFKADISERLKKGEALPKGLRADYRVFLFEDD